MALPTHLVVVGSERTISVMTRNEVVAATVLNGLVDSIVLYKAYAIERLVSTREQDDRRYDGIAQRQF